MAADLRQVRDADDLRVFGDAAQLDADLIRRFATDAGVNPHRKSAFRPRRNPQTARC